MVHFVNQGNRHYFSDMIEQMHEHRRQIFVDELHWDLDVKDGREFDRFDTSDAVYLLDEYENGGGLRGSARLLPTTKPHLMSEVFAWLCEDEPPQGPLTWEISRVCPDPALKGGRERKPITRKMVCAAMEAGLFLGWNRLILQVGLEALPFCLRCGWDIKPLGLPRYTEKNEIIAAFTANITSAGLEAVRKSAGAENSVLQIPTGTVLTAA